MGAIQLRTEAPPLTPHELLVIKAIAQGMTDEEVGRYIAAQVGGKDRSPRTAQSHISNAKVYFFGRAGRHPRRLAIACYEFIYGTPQANFERGAKAQRELVLEELQDWLDVGTIGTEAKQVLGKLIRDLREGKFIPYSGEGE